MSLHIAVILGTTRANRQSEKVAQLIAEVGGGFSDVEVKLVDPRDFNLPGDGNDDGYRDSAYTDLTQWADGFFIVTPEYNHSFPGSLKRLLDSELKNYIHKPVAFAGVSSGAWGGVRAIEQLAVVVRELGLVASFADVQFPKVQEMFDDEGRLLNESYIKYIKSSWTELLWLAEVLKHGRDTVANTYH